MAKNPSTTRSLLAVAVLLGGVAFMVTLAALPWGEDTPQSVAIPKERFMEDVADAAPVVLRAEDPELRALQDRFYAALAAGDMQALRALWATSEDVVYMRPGTPPVRGWGSARGLLEDLVRSRRIASITVSDVRLRVGPAQAEVVGVERVELRTDAGTVTTENVVVNVFRRDGDSWKLVGHRAVPR